MRNAGNVKVTSPLMEMVQSVYHPIIKAKDMEGVEHGGVEHTAMDCQGLSLLKCLPLLKFMLQTLC